jgi:D-glycero-alpha-D-manno-heptose 1-phosphate guanylyltransferase
MSGQLPSPTTEAIILAGGLGTRLRSVLPDLPKAMAPVAEKPFLDWIIHRLMSWGVNRIILSLGYKHELVTEYLVSHFHGVDLRACVEDEPLGTGGGIRLAMAMALTDHPMVLNGDTFFDIDAAALTYAHHSHAAHCTLALKPQQNFDRYGVVTLDADGRVTGFQEKRHYAEGLINGGVYILDRRRFLAEDLPNKFSFEKDYLEAKTSSRLFYGLPQDRYFIDIGIPEDYARAQLEIPEMMGN